MRYKKTIISCLILFSGISLNVFAQSLNFDLENLREQNELFTKAYDNIKAQQAWEAIQEAIQNNNLSLSDVIVGIVDIGGVEVAHQEFRGAIVNDDFVGLVDFGNTPPSARVDNDGHPTPIAGIIGANNLSFFTDTDSNSFQMTGILGGASPESFYTLEVRERGSNSFIWDEFKTLFQQKLSGADVVNLSIGLTKRSALTQDQINSGLITGQAGSISFATANAIWKFVFNNSPDTLFVPAAGNENVDVENTTPANLGDLPNVITIGAVDLEDDRAKFNDSQESNFGDKVSISAPGKNIFTPARGRSYLIPQEVLDDRIIGGFGGTSGAAPFVTGVAGLLKAVNPNLTPLEIKQILIETADPIQTGETDKRLGTGCYSDPNDDENTGCRLNAHSAVCHEKALNCQPETAGDSPWPQYQHDSRHTGLSEFQGPQTNNIKWRYPNTDAISVSTPVVGPGDVTYFGIKESDSTDRLIALNPDGSLRFKTTELNSPISSPAVISNGIVMVVTGAGSHIVAFEDKHAPNEEQAPLWTEFVDNNIGNMVLSDDDTLYFVTPGLFLHSYTPTQEGVTENWSTILDPVSSSTGTPTLGVGESGNIYLLRTVGFVPPRTRIYIIDPEDGSNARPPITVSGQPSADSLLVLEDDTIVVGLPGILRAIDPATGTGISLSLPHGRNTVPVLLPDGNIAIGVKEGPISPPLEPGNAVVHKIDLNLDNEDPPHVLHTVQLGTAVTLGNPVVDSDGTIYLTKRNISSLEEDSSTLHAIGPGNIVQFTKDATRFPGNLAIGSNGTLYSSALEMVSGLLRPNLWAVGE